MTHSDGMLYVCMYIVCMYYGDCNDSSFQNVRLTALECVMIAQIAQEQVLAKWEGCVRDMGCVMDV